MTPEPVLSVSHPCPYLISRMQQEEQGYFCQSCSQHIVDFRGMSAQEIVEQSTPDTCGIFTADQLKGQRRMGYWGKLCFYALMLWSFLGFDVQPIEACEIGDERPLLNQNFNEQSELRKPPRYSRRESRRERRRDRRWARRHSKANYNTMILGRPRYFD